MQFHILYTTQLDVLLFHDNSNTYQDLWFHAQTAQELYWFLGLLYGTNHNDDNLFWADIVYIRHQIHRNSPKAHRYIRTDVDPS